MNQPTSTQVTNAASLFSSFRKRLQEVAHQLQHGLPVEEEPSPYAQRNLAIICCWRLNPLPRILAYFGISKAWFYRLLHKFVEAGLAGLEDRRGRPKGTGKKLSPLEQGLIVKIRTGCPRVGSRRLEELLGSRLSYHHVTIHRFLREQALVRKCPYKRRKPFQKHRKSEANACWNLDFTAFFSEVLQERVFRFEIVDDCTNARLSTKLCLEETGEEAVAAVRKAIQRYGTPKALHSDQGTQFMGSRSRAPSQVFAKLAADYPGLTFSYARPGRPNENGKAEHACRDFKVEFLSDPQLFKQVCADPTGPRAEELLVLFNRFQNWLPNQGHHLFGARPCELHPRIAITKQEALAAFEELYLLPKGLQFNKEEWQLLLKRDN